MQSLNPEKPDSLENVVLPGAEGSESATIPLPTQGHGLGCSHTVGSLTESRSLGKRVCDVKGMGWKSKQKLQGPQAGRQCPGTPGAGGGERTAHREKCCQKLLVGAV